MMKTNCYDRSNKYYAQVTLTTVEHYVLSGMSALLMNFNKMLHTGNHKIINDFVSIFFLYVINLQIGNNN